MPPLPTLRQVQLTVGLYEMTRWRPDDVNISAVLGEELQDAWEAAAPSTDRQQWLNVRMIAWLDNCAAARWELVVGEKLEMPELG